MTDTKDIERTDVKGDVSKVDTLDVGPRSTDEGVDWAYMQKSELISRCLQEEIGFGRYQLELFLLSGIGWMADNLWLQAVAVVLPQVQQEFNPPRIEFVTLSLYAGLIVGATTWGCLADLIGRRLSWQITLFIAGTFGIASGGSPNFVTLCSLIACVGFGVGGNLPVDGALFLEQISQSHQWLLTFLSAFWSLGQLVGSLIVWPFIVNFSCSSDIPAGQCPIADNKGWRYSLYTMGAITFVMFLCRYVIFNLQESPKYLAATGRDEEAIQALEYIARRNGKTISLTAVDLQAFSVSEARDTRLSAFTILRQSLKHFSLSHVMSLFSTRRLALNTSLTILIWGTIGLAYPLFNGFLPLYLETRLRSASSSLDTTYRDYTIVSVLGVPGSIIACVLVDWTRKAGSVSIGGRKMALALFTMLTGVFLFLFTTAKTNSAYLGYSCASSLTQNAMYGVLYAYTPEVFPAPHRGTGDALCSAFNRITGILAPVVKIATTSRDGSTSSINPNAPVFVSASLFLLAALLTIFLPIETAGKAAL